MRATQRGLGWFGSLIVLALAVGAGYYLYQTMVVGDDHPSCKQEFNDCLHRCRQSASDNAAIQSCQARCRRDADQCSALRER